MRRFYFVAMIVGAALPLYFFIGHAAEQGMGLGDFLAGAFANKVSAGLVSDLLISAVLALVFIGRDARALGIRRTWLLVPAVCLVGLSFALPLYLYWREGAAERASGAAVSQRAASLGR